ncbi:MAG: hypothetical protein V3V10_06745 [Planctomycetota bacterium]
MTISISFLLITSAFAVDTNDAQRPPRGFPGGRNNDLDLGAVWNTAHWTIILGLENDNLPVWFGKSKKKKSSKEGKEG